VDEYVTYNSAKLHEVFTLINFMTCCVFLPFRHGSIKESCRDVSNHLSSDRSDSHLTTLLNAHYYYTTRSVRGFVSKFYAKLV